MRDTPVFEQRWVHDLLRQRRTHTLGTSGAPQGQGGGLSPGFELLMGDLREDSREQSFALGSMLSGSGGLGGQVVLRLRLSVFMNLLWERRIEQS